MQPLKGLTVVTLEHAIAAPLATRQLADLGARFIKIEPPGGPFPTGDGGTVMPGLQNDREWVKFCELVLLQPALASDPRYPGNAKRVAARESLHALIVEVFRPLTAPQLVERLEAAQIANARVHTMQEVWDHPQLAARECWREVGSPVGPLPAMLPPGTWNEGPRMDPVPALGEHTDALLAELGYDAAAIAHLHAVNAV